MTTVAIARTTSVHALRFSRLRGHERTRGKIGVARTECSNIQRQKHCREQGGDGKRPLAAFHGSTPFRSKSFLDAGFEGFEHGTPLFLLRVD
ncbi:MAG: hypothetical protein WAK67_15390, partial [Xanthobacteraceae bacterium]